ncbi:MAG TPA: adenosylhomocysteinase [Candidatus Cryosericum sp.]|nr:adenosylhomocysteinase [Candidatus Cryosericum sp.]
MNAQSGEQKMQWAIRHMPILSGIAERFEQQQPFAGLNVVIALHLEAKTANLAYVMQRGGARVAITASNPITTQDDVAEALAARGVTVFAKRGETAAEYKEYFDRVLATQPNLLIDDGGDLVNAVHFSHPELLPAIIGACEETTTGVVRDRALARSGNLAFPVIGVNEGLCKHLFDNRFGTGQSAWDGILRTTNLNIAGKVVVVAGYGWVGRGVALRARGLGAQVIVTEVDPVKAVEAHMDGYQVMPMLEAARLGEFFVTCTGDTRVISAPHFDAMKDGAILCNAGHFDVEVDVHCLQDHDPGHHEVRHGIEEYAWNDKHLYVLGEGRLVNLACADGHPVEIMDLTFALQALSAEYLVKHRESLPHELIGVPEAIDDMASRAFLVSRGLSIDALTDEQRAYLGSY